MSKRFIDTEIFSDEWFMDLPKDAKLLYIYLFANCDHAGVIKLNTKLVKFQIGIKDLDNSLKQLGNRLICFDNQQPNVYFLPKFLKFQYPNFPKSNVRQQDSALKILENYGIDFKTYLSVKDTYEHEHEHEHDSGCDTIKTPTEALEKFKDGIDENRINYSKDMLNEFYEYWTEPDKNGKLRFQLQKTWDTKRRLARWNRNGFDTKDKKPTLSVD